MTRQTEAEIAEMDAAVAAYEAASAEFFVVGCAYPDTRFFVANRPAPDDVGDFVMLTHVKAICREAADAMAASLNKSCLFTDRERFGEIAKDFEIQARIADCLRQLAPLADVETAAARLAEAKPWRDCHKVRALADDDDVF